MYNEKKVRKVKNIILIGGIILFFLTSFGLGFGIGSSGKKAPPKKVEEPKTSEEEKGTLTDGTVEKFLIAYYTKKDLGENQNRYQPLMTTGMYNQAIAEEEEPVNQAYKGYIINQVFNQAEIYINNENLTAIAVVNYKNTQRTKLNSDIGALVDEPNNETIRITFLKQGNKYLVNQIERITLLTPTEKNKNSYTEAPKPKEKNSEEEFSTSEQIKQPTVSNEEGEKDE